MAKAVLCTGNKGKAMNARVSQTEGSALNSQQIEQMILKILESFVQDVRQELLVVKQQNRDIMHHLYLDSHDPPGLGGTDPD